MSTLPKRFLTPQEYLEIERKAEFRSECYQGEMFAMAGASETHTMLSDNIIVLLVPKLRGGPCRAYSQNMRVQVGNTGLYTYPDIVVGCGERKFLDGHRDTLLNPTLIIKVLSPSTEAYDRGKKFTHYRSIESLQEYVLVSQDHVQVERYRRQPNGEWSLAALDRPEDSVNFESLSCELRLSDIYEDVKFASEATAVG